MSLYCPAFCANFPHLHYLHRGLWGSLFTHHSDWPILRFMCIFSYRLICWDAFQLLPFPRKIRCVLKDLGDHSFSFLSPFTCKISRFSFAFSLIQNNYMTLHIFLTMVQFQWWGKRHQVIRQLVQGSFHHREKSTIKYKVLSWWWWVKTSQTDKIRWNFYYSNTFSTNNCYLLTGPDLKHLHIRSLASAVRVLVWNTSMRKCLWTSPSEGFLRDIWVKDQAYQESAQVTLWGNQWKFLCWVSFLQLILFPCKWIYRFCPWLLWVWWSTTS